MASIEDVLNALEANENKDELKAVVDGLKAEINKKNSEAKNLRERFKATEAAEKSTAEKLAKLIEREGLQLSEDDDFDDVIDRHFAERKKSQNGEIDSQEIVELRSQFAKLQREHDKIRKDKEAAEKLASAEKERRMRTDRDRQIVEALTAGKVLSPSKTAVIFATNVQTKEDESLVYVCDDGSEVSIKEGVEQFLKTNPEFAANVQSPGSGSGTRSGAGGSRIYTRAEIDAMDSATRMDLFNKGLLNESLKNL